MRDGGGARRRDDDVGGGGGGGRGGVADAEARGLPHPCGAAVPGGAVEEEGRRDGGGGRREQAAGPAQGRVLPATGPRVPVRARASEGAGGGLKPRVVIKAGHVRVLLMYASAGHGPPAGEPTIASGMVVE